MRDTITAVAASGAIGIVRLSGPHAVEALETLFRPANGEMLSDQPANHLTFGTVTVDGAALDRCFAVRLEAPRTATGEDMAELQCHGSPAVLQAVLDALYKVGVRQAGPGEFTRRAFLNGKLDLSAAEAVNDLVLARTAEAARNAAGQLMGAVGGRLNGLREELLALTAHFYAVIDYPDDDIEPFLYQTAQKTIEKALSVLQKLTESYARGRVLREGVSCAILGRPNVGKSSLLNALLGRDRAIVTAVAGTTRDVLEETVRLGPVLLRLSDTAGLRTTSDPIEQEGIERALCAADQARLVLAMFDGSAPLTDDDWLVIDRAAGRESVAVVNKCDLDTALDLAALREHFTKVVPISARTGEGIDRLSETLSALVGLDSAAFDGETITNARQAEALTRAAERLTAANAAAQTGLTPDAVLMDVEGAISALGEVTGQNVTEDLVNTIFSNFCVGK